MSVFYKLYVKSFENFQGWYGEAFKEAIDGKNGHFLKHFVEITVFSYVTCRKKTGSLIEHIAHAKVEYMRGY